MELMKFSDALTSIMDAVARRLEEEKMEGQYHTLLSVEQIVRADRSRPQPRTPALWIQPLTATPSHERRTKACVWSQQIQITSLVKSQDPEEGYRTATVLAADAQSAVLKDRTLGCLGFVQDVRAGNFEPSGPDFQRNDLFASLAIVEVHFVILEHNP